MIPRVFAAVCALLIGAAHLPAAAQQDGSSLDGKWSGRTSQGKSIALRIEAGIMQVLEVDWTMHVDEVCPGLAGSAPSLRIERGDNLFFYPRVRGFEPPETLYPSFEVSREMETAPVPITVTVIGTFGSDHSVAGELALTARGCAGHETIKWQASRKAARGGS